MNLFFDIETIPAEKELKDTIVELERKKEAKKAESEDLVGDIKKQRSPENIYRATSLSGDFGRIFCIAYAVGDDSVDVLKGEEKGILTKFW